MKASFTMSIIKIDCEHTSLINKDPANLVYIIDYQNNVNTKLLNILIWRVRVKQATVYGLGFLCVFGIAQLWRFRTCQAISICPHYSQGTTKNVVKIHMPQLKFN